MASDLAQTVRFATLEKFKAGELQLLVCSDVAARGLDIGGLSHVFNFDVPHHPEDYVHRIGRTGRAGMEGHAFTIAMPEDRYAVEAIEKLIGHPIPPVTVEALDPVDWVEEDSRRRRGRGRAKPNTAAKEKVVAKPRKAKPAPQPAVPEATAPAPVSRTRRQRAARGTEPKPAPSHSQRPSRRDWPRKGEETGRSVVGFGDEVPAFMLVRARQGRVARQAASQGGGQGEGEP